jgi:hypothetical protein
MDPDILPPRSPPCGEMPTDVVGGGVSSSGDEFHAYGMSYV